MKQIKLIILFFLLPIFLVGQELFLYNEANSPLNSNGLTSLAIDSSNTIWVGSDTTLYQFNNINWIQSLTNSRYFPDIEVSPNGTVFTITHSEDYSSNVVKRIGNSWDVIKPDLSTMFNEPFSISIKNDTTIYFPLWNNWNSTVGYNTIGIFSGGDSITIKTPRVYMLMSIAPLNGDSLLMTDAEGIHLFTGANWDLNEEDWILKNPEGTDVEPNSLIAKKINSHVYVFGEKFFEYKNNSYLSFPKIDSVLVADSITATAIDVENNNIFWIGTSSGKLIKYSDSIKTFDLTNSKIKDIAIDRDGNKWFISGEGLFVFNEEKIVSVKHEEKLPEYLRLYQNYPNPFNPNTTIQYSLPANVVLNATSTIVNLKVYDILGREIATLVNQEQNAGNYDVNFDASKLTSGIYFYRLQYGSLITSKKMILLK